MKFSDAVIFFGEIFGVYENIATEVNFRAEGGVLGGIYMPRTEIPHISFQVIKKEHFNPLGVTIKDGGLLGDKIKVRVDDKLVQKHLSSLENITRLLTKGETPLLYLVKKRYDLDEDDKKEVNLMKKAFKGVLEHDDQDIFKFRSAINKEWRFCRNYPTDQITRDTMEMYRQLKMFDDKNFDSYFNILNTERNISMFKAIYHHDRNNIVKLCKAYSYAISSEATKQLFKEQEQ